MSKRILPTLLVWLALILPALAQNVTCATRPVGDSSNACASTAFVQQNGGGGGGGGGTAFQQTFAAGAGFTPGTTTTLTLTHPPSTAAGLWVFFDGAFQDPTQWSLASSTLTFNNPIQAQSIVTVISGVPVSGGGTVTSIGITPTSPLAVTGSPVTSAGNIGLSLGTQSANTTLSGPASGSASAPAFRGLVTADLPSFLQLGTGTGNQTYLARGQKQVLVTDYCVSTDGGTVETGTISLSTPTTLSLSAAGSFQNCQHVRVDKAGAAFSLSAPTVGTISIIGSTGANTRCYRFSSLDYSGGVGAATTAACTTTAPTTPTPSNYVSVAMTQATSTSGYAAWEGPSSSGPWTYIGVGVGSTFPDTYWVPSNRPEYLPANPPSASIPDWLVSQISSGGGTTTLTLATAATSAVSGANVYHDETVGFNNAISSNASTGVDVIVPCGIYNTTNLIDFEASGEGISGTGLRCNEIQSFGADATFTCHNSSTVPPDIYGNFIENIYEAAYNKTGGQSVYVQACSEFALSNYIADHPPSGFYFHNVNDVRLTHNRAFGLWGIGSAFIQVDTDNTNTSCCFADFDNYGTGNSTAGGLRRTNDGIVFNGDVQTIYSVGDAVSNIEGDGWILENTTGNSTNPQFIQLLYPSSEFSNDRAFEAAKGQRIYISDMTFHGSWGPSAINFAIENGVGTVDLSGGSLTGSGCQAFYSDGQQVSVRGVDMLDNSESNRGGTSGVCIAMELGPDSIGSVVMGNNIGYLSNTGQQASPGQADSGADHYTITGNNFVGNASTVFSGATSSTQVITNNAQ